MAKAKEIAEENDEKAKAKKSIAIISGESNIKRNGDIGWRQAKEYQQLARNNGEGMKKHAAWRQRKENIISSIWRSRLAAAAIMAAAKARKLGISSESGDKAA